MTAGGPAQAAERAKPVLVVDDHELVRVALVKTLRAHGIAALDCPDRSVRGIVAAASAAHPPGLALLDLDLGPGPDGTHVDGVDAIPLLRSAGWSVLVVTGGRQRQIAAAIAAGAVGHVPKTAGFDTLVETVLLALSGAPLMTLAQRRTWLEYHDAERAEAGRRVALLRRLTPRERAILERLAAGLRPAEIARQSVVSVATVRTQIGSILAKLEVNSQLGAVAIVRGHLAD